MSLLENWCFLAALALLILILLCGCQALTPQQREQLARLQGNYAAAVGEAEKAADQIARLYSLQDEVRAKIARGEVTPDYASQTLAELASELARTRERYAFFKDSAERIAGDLRALRESGTPWWAVIATVLTSGTTVALLRKYLGWRAAAADLCAGIESAGDPATKRAVHALGNALVEHHVKQQYRAHANQNAQPPEGRGAAGA